MQTASSPLPGKLRRQRYLAAVVGMLASIGALFARAAPDDDEANALNVPDAADVPPARDPDPTSQLRLLVADDNKINRQLFAALLRSEGYHIELVENGEQAVAAVAAGNFDAVLLDVQMAVMNGIDATRMIRALPGPPGRVPILGVMAHAGRIDKEECFAAGMTDYLGSPINNVRLVAKLAELLERNIPPAAAPPTAADALDPTRPEHRSTVPPTTALPVFDDPAEKFADRPPALRLLIADDNAVMRKLYEVLLLAHGYRLEMVENGEAAVAAAVAGDFDGILMDVQMPVMDGIEATRRIRALPGARGRVPILGMTAHPMIGTKVKCLAVGMNDYLRPPISGSDLLTRIAALLESPAPAVAAKPRAPVGFDTERLQELGALLPAETLREIFLIFIDEAVDRLPKLRKLATGGDLDALRREAHAMLGIAGNVAASCLADAARAVEAACHAGDRDTVTRLAAELCDALQDAERAMQLWLDHMAMPRTAA